MAEELRPLTLEQTNEVGLLIKKLCQLTGWSAQQWLLDDDTVCGFSIAPEPLLSGEIDHFVTDQVVSFEKDH